MKRNTIVITLLLTLFTMSCGSRPDGNTNTDTSQTRTTAIDLLPEIKLFLDKHKELGVPVKSDPAIDWANGEKQRVIFDDKRDLLFYTQDSAVVTVYEDARDGTKVIWGDPIKIE
jgi:hypothetical protein